MKIIGLMLVRNEEERWLKDVLIRMKLLCDKVIILDDDSTDNTAQICRNFNCEVYTSEKSLWGVNELIQRQKLFQLGISYANNNDWLICLDADEVLVIQHISYLKHVMKSVSNGINGLAFRLYDMWNEKQYRADNLWTAHNRYWTMAIRYRENFNYEWIQRPLHCGRFPMNSSPQTMPTFIPIKHMGWSREEDRIKKYNRYIEVDPQGKHGLISQYLSILDENPNLAEFVEE